MLRYIKKITLSLLVLVACAIAVPSPAFAGVDLFTSGGNGIDCSSTDASQSAVCKEHGTTDNPVGGKGGMLDHITNIIAGVAGMAAIIVMIVGAIRYITSGSDISTSSRHDNDVEEAKRTIGNAFVGLVVVVLARTLILFVVDKF
jgi:hypothetical protein